MMCGLVAADRRTGLLPISLGLVIGALDDAELRRAVSRAVLPLRLLPATKGKVPAIRDPIEFYTPLLSANVMREPRYLRADLIIVIPDLIP